MTDDDLDDDLPEEGADFDVEAYVAGIHAELDEVLGPDATVRLAVIADHEIGHIIQAMLFLYGVDGVRAATKRLRSSVDVGERNALLSNEPMMPDPLNS